MIITIEATFAPPVVRVRFDGNYITHISPEILEDMRAWAVDCEWRESDEGEDFDPWKLSDKEIIRGIQNNFGGGLVGFVETY